MLLLILLILVGTELPLFTATVLECCVIFSGVKLSIRSFVLLFEVSVFINGDQAAQKIQG